MIYEEVTQIFLFALRINAQSYRRESTRTGQWLLRVHVAQTEMPEKARFV